MSILRRKTENLNQEYRKNFHIFQNRNFRSKNIFTKLHCSFSRSIFSIEKFSGKIRWIINPNLAVLAPKTAVFNTYNRNYLGNIISPESHHLAMNNQFQSTKGLKRIVLKIWNIITNKNDLNYRDQ